MASSLGEVGIDPATNCRQHGGGGGGAAGDGGGSQWCGREEKHIVGRRRHTTTEVAKPHVTKTLRKGGKHFRMIIILYQ